VRRSRFNEEQIIGILKESEAGTDPGELCRLPVQCAHFPGSRSLLTDGHFTGLRMVTTAH
jgi:hypothetical protein